MITKNDSSANRIAYIDLLRGFAIFGVVYHHLFSRFTVHGYKSETIFGFEFYPYTLLSNGFLGVNLFFFLSGFVLYYPYALQKRTMTSGSDVWEFYKRRAKRLFPLYYFSILICSLFLYAGFSQEDFFTKLLMGFTFTNIFNVDQFFPAYNWVLWSLEIELWFSVLFPLIIFSIIKLGDTKTLILAMAIALTVRIIGMDEQYFIENSPYLNAVKDSVFGRLDDFVIGMYCCYVCVNGKLGFIKSSNALFFTILGLIFGITGCLLWDYVMTKKISNDVVPYTYLVLNLSFFTMTLSIYRMRDTAKSFFSIWPIRVIGMMCYSMYVWHGLLMIAVFGVVGWQFNFDTVSSYYLLLIVFTVLSYRYIEFGHVSDTKKLFGLARK